MAVDIMLYYDYGIKILGVASFMGCLYLLSLVKKSVGWSFARALSKAKMSALKNKSVIILRIRDLAGAEVYETKEVSELITYSFKQNGKMLDKVVIYNERAVTMWNGIKILNVSPSSVLPIDRDTGLYVNVNPELTNKIVTDSGKTAESEKSHKELLKNFIWFGALVLVATVVAISFMYDANIDTVEELKACYAAGKTSATIIANG